MKLHAIYVLKIYHRQGDKRLVTSIVLLSIICHFIVQLFALSSPLLPQTTVETYSALRASTNCQTVKPMPNSATSSLSSQRSKHSDEDSAAFGDQDYLVNSPYWETGHLLDLGSIGTPQRLLAKALTVMAPIRGDYATAPYSDAFNWGLVVSVLKSLVEIENYAWKHQSFYVVVFRSQVPPTTDRSHLAALDRRSHAEAMESGGLLKYWFGTLDIDGRNMATCKSHSTLQS